jgi:hypothetical protein
MGGEALEEFYITGHFEKANPVFAINSARSSLGLSVTGLYF